MTDGYWTDGPLADPVPQRTAVPTPEQRAADDAQAKLLAEMIIKDATWPLLQSIGD